MLKFLKEHRYIAAWIAVTIGALGLVAAYMNPPGTNREQELSEPALEGVATFHYVSFPESIRKTLREFGHFKTAKEQVELPDELSSLSEAQRKSLYELIDTYVNNQLSGIIGPYGLTKYRGYMSIRIRNLTTRTLEDVTLQLPYFFRIAEVYRKGIGSQELTDFANQIQFGKMRPEEEISVTAWLDSFPTSFGEKMKLLHRDGVGPVYKTTSKVDRE